MGGPEQAGSAVTNLTSVLITGGYMGVRHGGIQVHPTNGEELGNRRVYPVKTCNGDRSPLYVSAGDGSPAHEYVSEVGMGTRPDSSWTDAMGYGTKCLPRGWHKSLDFSKVEMFIDVSPLKRSVYGCYSGVIVSYTLIPVLGKFVLAF
ncbi:MAG: hypothetical protein IKK82_03460 [Kiritimatiellae bacterium]|nr:hypothetical protein [Kiritimatiellia bacterium]